MKTMLMDSPITFCIQFILCKTGFYFYRKRKGLSILRRRLWNDYNLYTELKEVVVSMECYLRSSTVQEKLSSLRSVER